MKFFIHTPPYCNTSAGIRVLYKLSNLIAQSGHESVPIVFGEEPWQQVVSDDDVVIYPEVTIGNPLRGKKIVRYLLNIPGACGGDGKFSIDDYLISFNKQHADLTGGKYMPILVLEEFFCDDHLAKTHDALWVGKYRGLNPINITAIPITYSFPVNRKLLAEFLKHTDTLYTLDKLSMLNYEALACGAKVIFVDSDGSTTNITRDDSLFYNWIEHFNQFIKDMEQWQVKDVNLIPAN